MMGKRPVQQIPAAFDQITAQMLGVKIPREKRVVSMFSGCGGLDLGFLGGFKYLGRIYDRLPFRIIWANDNNESACETYRHNLREDIHCGDVWEALDTLPKTADIVIGGFPCQDVSINGKRNGLGKRTILYKAMLEAINRVKPKVFVAENVKGLTMNHNEESFKQMISEFEDAGYSVDWRIYLAADYGVPQMRERIFIVGTKAKGKIKPFSPPEPELLSSEWITARDAIGDLEDVAENAVDNHTWSRAERSPDQGNRILKADRPSDTIRAECHGNIQFHYSLPRRLSMREAARIQSFPDNFRFMAKLRNTERQVGNAVPPVLAWHIARAVLECFGE